MKTLEWREREKWETANEWPPGPWDKEPDRKQWKDQQTGLPCLIVRNGAGAWCGYVGVTEEHPWFRIPYNEKDVSPDFQCDVHGGLTYSGACHHEVEPGEDDQVWWFGFDCSHCDDLAPGTVAPMVEMVNSLFETGLSHEVYRTQEYVEREVAGLAKQIEAVAACTTPISP